MTLYTGISWDNFFRLNRWLLAYSRLMHTPVQPESKRAMMDFFSAVSVVSISTFNLSEVETRCEGEGVLIVQGLVITGDYQLGVQVFFVFQFP